MKIKINKLNIGYNYRPVLIAEISGNHNGSKQMFLELIKSIRLIESAKGSGKKIPTKSEQKNLKNNRVSIVTLERILKGTKISRDMIDIKRPGSGIQPIYWNEVIKKIAKKDIDNEIPLQWSMLE